MRSIKQSVKHLLFGLVLSLGVMNHQAWAESAHPPTQPISDLSFWEIRQTKQGLTDIQWEAYNKSLEGKRIRWTGYVEDVTKPIFGGYKVLVDMDPPSDTLSVQDIYFSIPKEQAASVQKDSAITFEGTIDAVMSVLGSIQISLKDAYIVFPFHL